MKSIKLTEAEKTSLEDRHRCPRDKKESDRIKAVLLRSEGWTVPMISQALRLHETSVTRHINDYREGKLTITNGGSNSMLSKTQTVELLHHLTATTYQTIQAITAYIKDTYGISYSIPGLNKWLHRNGFSYKKPKGYPYKASKEQQEKFIAAYNELKKTILPDDGILFMDSCHPSMAAKLSYGWIRTGQSKPMKTTASRTRINLVGTINLDSLSKPVVCSYTTVDGESIVDFLSQVRKHSIHLVLDQAGYHRCAEVVNAAAKLNIKLLYLPAYSPNLNPIERLWKVMNEHARNNKFFRTAQYFRQSIDNFFQSTLPQIASSLEARINDNFQKLDYAFLSVMGILHYN